jgi:cell wall-associated NlpC family hydrolase
MEERPAGYPAGDGAVTNTTPVHVSGSRIAADAVTYAGSGYVYGGTPGTGRGNWDCSSFVNAVIGRDLELPIPGFAAGAYRGQVHGPDVLDWAAWGGVSPVSSPVAGDLACWPGAGPDGHIGIALDDAHMISALDTQDGTVKTPIEGYGPQGVQVVFRRLNGTAPGPGQAAPSAAGSGSCPVTLAMILVVLSGAGAGVVELAMHVRL